MRSIMRKQHDGKHLLGFAVSDNMFIGISTLDELETLGLKRPTMIEDSKVKERKSDHKLGMAHDVREQVQRRFDVPRRRRAGAYAKYLGEVAGGARFGSAPPVTLFTPFQGVVDDDSGDLVLEHVAPLVNLDGETQTEARFVLREEKPDTGSILPVSYVLHHGISAAHAASIMHDFNCYARPVTETKIAVLNSNGLLTRTVVEIIEEMQIGAGEIARLTPTPNKKQFASWTALVAGAAGALTGRAVTDNYAGHVARLNQQVNGIDPEEYLKPFLRHAIALARANPAVGRTGKLVWALAGGHFHDTGELLDEARWLALNGGFNVRLGKGTPKAKVVKRQNAFRAIGVELGGAA
jgi:hypothetical protein